MKQRLLKILILGISVVFSLFIVELYFRLSFNKNYYVWPPKLKQYFFPDSTVFTGIKDSSYFAINSNGFRAEELTDTNTINILALGGSTTECPYLDQKETWTYLLEQKLNESSAASRFRVFNAGRSGLNSQHHLFQLSILLKQFDWIDVVIVLQGINDFQYALSLGEEYKPLDVEAVKSKSFHQGPLDAKLPFYKRFFVYSYLSEIKRALFSSELGQDPYGLNYIRWRTNRKKSILVDREPNLEKSLHDYAGNIDSIIKITQRFNTPVIFMTQPVSWAQKTDSIIATMCWFGWMGKTQDENNGAYYSLSQLKRGIDMYNEAMKKACTKNKIGIIDLERNLEKNISTFYDDCHFNESGAEKVANFIFHYLRNNQKDLNLQKRPKS